MLGRLHLDLSQGIEELRINSALSSTEWHLKIQVTQATVYYAKDLNNLGNPLKIATRR